MVLAVAVAVSTPIVASAAQFRHTHKGSQVEITFGSDTVTYKFSGFSPEAHVVARERYHISGRHASFETFEFNGPTGENTITYIPPTGKGEYVIKASVSSLTIS